MAKRDEIIRYCNDLLNASGIQDSLPIGLQVEGCEDVTKIVTGVSACRELFEEAARRGAQMVIVHHGMFWDGQSRVIEGVGKGRIKTLLDNDITLLGYHLPLDLHATVGNNAMIAKQLGLVDMAPFGEYHSIDIGFKGRFATPRPIAEMKLMLTRMFGRAPIAYEYGCDEICAVGIVSGGAAGLVDQAVAQGLDAYVTGEVAEPTMNYCREARVNFYGCGHYYTEKVGVQALGADLARQFGVEVEFVEIANEV